MNYLAYALVLGLSLVPFAAGAQEAGLVNCGLDASSYDCNFCTLMEMVNSIIRWLIAFLSIIAVGVMVYAGFKMVTSGGNTSAWEEGKSLFTNVVIGIIIVLASWLIVDTVLETLTGSGINEWFPSDCGGGTPVAATGQQQGNIVNGDQYADAEARAALAAAGIGVWESAPGRTSLTGINQATIDEAIRLRQSCNCSVTVTGGTESGHADGTYSHGTGYKIDLDDSPGLTAYIRNTYSRSGTRSDGAALYTNSSRPGVEYAHEGDHWDITVR